MPITNADARRLPLEPKANTEATPETLWDVACRDTSGCNNCPSRPFLPRVSDFVGVCRTVSGLWYARIWTGKKWQGLGFWEQAEDAAREYDRSARMRYGPFVHQNFPIAPGIAISRDPEADGIAATTMPARRVRALGRVS